MRNYLLFILILIFTGYETDKTIGRYIVRIQSIQGTTEERTPTNRGDTSNQGGQVEEKNAKITENRKSKGVEVNSKKPIRPKNKTTTISSIQKQVLPITNKGRYGVGSCEKWDKLIDKYGKNREEKKWAKRVMRCESGCNALVVNKYGYTGLFQWSPYYWSKQFKEDIFDGEAQIKNSLIKYRLGGKGIWECK